MLKRALRSARKLTAGQALAFAIVGIALIYSIVYRDAYISLLMLPFFALGCARGKPPIVLIALSALPALIFLTVSFIKFMLLGVPLVTYDHYFLRTNVLVLAYNDWRVAAGLVVLVAAVAYYMRRLLSGRGRFSRFERGFLATLTLVAIICVVSLQRWQQIAIWDAAANTPTLKTFLLSSQVPPPQLHVVVNAGPAPIEKPPAADTPLGPPAGPLPDLFFVLQESTFPPAVLRPGFEPQTLFAPNAGQTGPLRVHTFAGGTWRTEFSVTVQMRPQEFGSDGLYVFHQLEGRVKRSIFTELKKLGYRTMVFYPVPGSFINAEAFYKSIGVDEFYDPQSLGISAGWDWNFPDALLYDAMLKKVAGATTPVVALMLTINQHGPHNVEDPMTDYVARFTASDRAYGDFLDALAQRPGKSGVVAFGDHQPEFTARFIEDDHALHLTAYDIRCVNFQCAADSDATGDKTLDAVMLAPAAFERFGFTLDSFSLRQRELFQACAGDVDRCDDSARIEFNTAFAQFFD